MITTVARIRSKQFSSIFEKQFRDVACVDCVSIEESLAALEEVGVRPNHILFAVSNS